MKKNLFFILALTMVIVACNQKETSQTAQDYHSALITIQTSVDNALVEIIDALSNNDEAEIIAAQETAKTILVDALEKLEKIDDFDGNDEYKKEMTKLLSMYEDILENEIPYMVDYTMYFDELTDEEWDAYYLINDSMLDKYEKAHDEFGKYQNDFAKNWDFALD